MPMSPDYVFYVSFFRLVQNGDGLAVFWHSCRSKHEKETHKDDQMTQECDKMTQRDDKYSRRWQDDTEG